VKNSKKESSTTEKGEQYLEKDLEDVRKGRIGPVWLKNEKILGRRGRAYSVGEEREKPKRRKRNFGRCLKSQ